MFTVDVDVHINDQPGALAPYCDLPWRLSLEQLADGPQRYLDAAGYAPNLKLDPPEPRVPRDRSVHSAAEMRVRSVNSAVEMRAQLTELGVDVGILFPDHMLLFAPIPHIEYATALSHAYNRWLTEKWLQQEEGLYGVVLACPQDPIDSAQEIRRYAKEPGIVGVYLPTAGVTPLWGHRMYDPIMAAAAESDLPVCLHSVTLVSPAFPCQLDQFENIFARQVLSHSFAMTSNLVSLMHTGVPARYPDLKFVFTEAGIAWVPYLTWRMDKYHQEYRRIVPVLERRPSDYLKEQMWFATQPIEEPDDPTFLVETIRHCGEDRILFASDWPHHDFDHPKAVLKLPMSNEMKRKIMGENALSAFSRIPKPSPVELSGVR